MNTLTCFKAYDIRGRLPEELNPDIAFAIGRAFAGYLQPTTVVVGGDIRLSTSDLKEALSDGLRSTGCDVLDLGLCGTEEIYFATQHLGVDGGIMVTASHNPIDYNGMKLVRKESQPISGDTGLRAIQALAETCFLSEDFAEQRKQPLQGSYRKVSTVSAYIDHILDYVKAQQLRPMKLVVNAGNGAAGPVIDAIEEQFERLGVPVQFIKIQHAPDGSFPNGIPNPLLPECRADTAQAVVTHQADMGIAWDGDFDRCFLFDEKGQFIEGYYIVGLLGEAFLSDECGAKIVHDPRLTWNTIEQVTSAGGVPVLCKTGHSFIKERMRRENAVYGGELSGHHYFRDFAYCDSGMIPWLLIAELMSRKALPLSELVAERIAMFPSSGEINSRLEDPQGAVERVLAAYRKKAVAIDYTDGISVDMGQWRFNLRTSNTEPVLRLNVESRGDPVCMKDKTDELLHCILEK